MIVPIKDIHIPADHPRAFYRRFTYSLAVLSVNKNRTLLVVRCDDRFFFRQISSDGCFSFFHKHTLAFIFRSVNSPSTLVEQASVRPAQLQCVLPFILAP
jgi:hypothetical protein